MVSGLVMTNLLFSYYFLRYGFSPQIVVVIAISMSMVVFLVRLWFYSKYYGRSKLRVLEAILFPAITVFLCSFIFPYLVTISQEPSLHRFIISSFTCMFSVIICTYFLGLDANEKNILKRMFKFYWIKLL